MGLPRTFVGFSSTDIHYFRLMQAWKANEHIDFDFIDCQLNIEVKSEDEYYIKRKCRERINASGTYAILIGEDTRYKYKYVRWEIEVAIEKGCRLIGINIDNSRFVNDRCPPIMRNKGAIFVPFSPRIVAHALQNYSKNPNDDYHYKDHVYQSLGY